eukprot:TRINITY_DN5763_c0_g1_i1.p1 TRINITY_DN5763_c0_g1~~TRINITY_DN5763_c0_g1_i1.p1  ORF type:complete len:261 (-),score=42.79 TRINITY_DN5763_c0_g1_i1:93-875(-)
MFLYLKHFGRSSIQLSSNQYYFSAANLNSKIIYKKATFPRNITITMASKSQQKKRTIEDVKKSEKIEKISSPSSSPLTRSFENIEQLNQWLEQNHATEKELWVRMYKKSTGTPSVTWDDCVLATLAWGWIDSTRKSFDEVSFIQRLSPRRPKSNWSKKNCEHVELLISEGKMQPSGLVHVEAAKSDGRWEKAYAGPATMVIPEDFVEELNKNPKAKKKYDTLNRSNLYQIYHKLTTAKRPETKKKRIEDILGKLSRGEDL